MKTRRSIFALLFLSLLHQPSEAQTVHEYNDSVVLSNSQVAVILNTTTGKLNYRFANGITLDNTVAYGEDIHSVPLTPTHSSPHPYTINPIKDHLVNSMRITFK